MPLVSIIVPVYNVEKYLNKCIDSVLCQTFTDFECILVNDDSPDNCPQICDEYAKIDDRIKVIHKKQNEGSPQARKTGLDLAMGEYILYIDSDDWIEPDMVEKMYSKAKNTDCDMVISGMFKSTDFEHVRSFSPEIHGKIPIIKKILMYSSFSPSVCNKLIKRKIYMKVIFPIRHYIDDRVITIQTVFFSQSINYINEYLYHYRKNPQSICESSEQINKNIDEYHNFLIIVDFLAGNELISKLEPELVFRINTIKLSFIINKNLRKLSYNIFSELYPQSTENIFKKKNKLNFFKRFLLFSAIKKLPFLYIIIDTCNMLGLFIRTLYRLFIPEKARKYIWGIRIKKNKELKIIINGDFLCRRLTGIERYAYEICNRIDKLSTKGEVAIVIPSFVQDIPDYQNFEIIRLERKSKSNIRWQMLTLQGFLLAHRKFTILEFGNTCLPLTPGIVFLHDIYCEFFPNDFISPRDKFTRLYSRLQYRMITRLAKEIVTVSQYSKNEISKTFTVNPAKISVIYSSADHMRDIHADHSVFEQFPILTEKPFFFYLGSLSKRKNISWILEYAAKHSDTIFALSGASLSTVKVNELDKEITSNVILLGYLDDGKVKALMEKCRAFILPSYYEGFGLTPLEALSCGTKIIVAKAASLPEIYENTAHYIDPFNTDVDLDELLKQPVDGPDEILERYCYDTSAEQVYKLIKDYST